MNKDDEKKDDENKNGKSYNGKLLLYTNNHIILINCSPSSPIRSLPFLHLLHIDVEFSSFALVHFKKIFFFAFWLLFFLSSCTRCSLFLPLIFAVSFFFCSLHIQHENLYETILDAGAFFFRRLFLPFSTHNCRLHCEFHLLLLLLGSMYYLCIIQSALVLAIELNHRSTKK